MIPHQANVAQKSNSRQGRTLEPPLGIQFVARGRPTSRFHHHFACSFDVRISSDDFNAFARKRERSGVASAVSRTSDESDLVL